MVESPLLQTRRTCIATHMIFNKKCYVDAVPHVSMDITQLKQLKKTWILVVGCTSRAHTQYKWRLAKRLGCDQLREHNGHNHAQRQNILIKAQSDITSQKINAYRGLK